MKYILFITLYSFLFSCQSDPKTIFDKERNSPDSLAIVQAFSKALINRDSASLYVGEAEATAGENKFLRDIYTFNRARYYLQSGQLATAGNLLDSTLKSYPEDDPKTGKYLSLLAAVSAYRNRSEQAVKYYERALTIFEKSGDANQAAAVHFNLANVFFGRLDFKASYRHISHAKKEFEALNNLTNEALASGILAVSLIKLDSLEKGKIIAEEALSKSTNNPMAAILANYALGEYAHSQERFDEALSFYDLAKKTGETFRIKNLELPVEAARLDALVKLKKAREAILTGESVLQLAVAQDNKEVQYPIYRNLAFGWEQAGNQAKALEYLKTGEEIFRNNMMENNQELMKEILIKYETEKKSRVIAQNESQIARQKLFISLLAGSVLIILAFLWAYYRNVSQQRKISRLNKEKEVNQARVEGEEQERKRLSEELHDGIASSLTAVRLKLENTGGDALAVRMVKDMHNEVRKVARNLMPVNFEKSALEDEIRNFCATLDTGNVTFFSNAPSPRIPSPHALILYRGVQELIQNAIKHAEAGKISVQLMVSGSHLTLGVEDNGKGFNPEALNGSSGLANLRNRLYKIGAELTLDSAADNGTTAFIEYSVL